MNRVVPFFMVLLNRVLIAFKYRLYPNKQQETMLLKHFGCCRWVFNWALADKTKAWQESKKRISRYDLDKQLPKLKKAAETTWLSEVNSQTLQQSLVHLELAFDKFFREKKGYPRFKSKHGPQAFSCPQSARVDEQSGTLSLPKIGWIPMAFSRSFSGNIKTVTVSRMPTGKYFASLLVEDGKPLPAPKKYGDKTTLGVDVGIKHFATLSTGEKIENPRHLKQNLARLKREQRRLSRRKKGSNNCNKQRLKVARLHEKVANCRKDFLHKLSTRLIRENQALAFETLNIAGMLRNHKLAQHIADVAWGMFFEFCGYKAEWKGKNILTIGQFRPSSRESVCGYVNADFKLSDRVWTCPHCGRTYDRDIQAAQNIKRWALHPENIRRDTPELKLVEVGNG